MILPIVAYGDSVLRKVAHDVTPEYFKDNNVIQDMFDTMYKAHGVGLAAPQVGLDIRLFIVDVSPFADDDDLPKQAQEELKNFKKVFINPTIIKEEGDEWAFNEGCLSIPDVREDVYRKRIVTIEYFDEKFQKFTETYNGLIARVIQHEYDHIEGILFTDRLSALKKRLISKRLNNIMMGKINPEYKMKFPNIKK